MLTQNPQASFFHEGEEKSTIPSFLVSIIRCGRAFQKLLVGYLCIMPLKNLEASVLLGLGLDSVGLII